MTRILAVLLVLLAALAPAGAEPVLWKAINFNGPGLTIDGHPFLAMADAGVTRNGTLFSNQAVVLNPATDSARAEMIRSSVWSTALSVKVNNVPTGAYDVFIYNWEDNSAQTFSLTLQGVLVADRVSSGPAGAWRKLGPYRVGVAAGQIALASQGGAFNLSGMEIYAVDDPGTRPPPLAEGPLRGMREVELRGSPGSRNPFFDVDLKVTFTRPDGRTTTVDGFFDGGDLFKARAYLDTIGVWTWRSHSNVAALDGKAGSFQVVASDRPGKLRQSTADPHQLVRDNGRWFLPIGDTGYRYVVDTEPLWKAYIDQASAMGATKVRTWFARARHDVTVLFKDSRANLNLAYWQEIDRRVAYAAEAHRGLVLQLIPFAEDTSELGRYLAGDRASRGMLRYAQARFSAYPNVVWCISNDRDLSVTTTRDAVDRIGADMHAREPWGTLVTNHQKRYSGYRFPVAGWSDVVTIEDLDQVHGKRILEYRGKSPDPAAVDEDRYETYLAPSHARYYFRRLMWASLLSGGSATYGGLMSWEPYDGLSKGVLGYFDAVAAGKLKDGAADFPRIARFFKEAGITLVGMSPADALVGSNPLHAKAMSAGDARFLVYLANPTGTAPQTDDAAAATPAVTILLPSGRTYAARWYEPDTGAWTDGGTVAGGSRTLAAPAGGDWVLLLTAVS